MFTSSAEVFRIRQSLGDLRAYLRESGTLVRARISEAMRDGISAHDAQARIDRVIDEQGARFLLPFDADVHEVCRLAAALPSDDFPAFTFSTALLLADRLQTGGSDDDLYWNWDAFRADYALADPSVRSALMNGFRIGKETGRLEIDTLPRSEHCQTRTKDVVLRQLEELGDARLFALVEGEPTAEMAGMAWIDRAAGEMTDAMQLAFRYLYERPQSMSPSRASDAPLIPWSL